MSSRLEHEGEGSRHGVASGIIRQFFLAYVIDGAAPTERLPHDYVIVVGKTLGKEAT